MGHRLFILILSFLLPLSLSAAEVQIPSFSPRTVLQAIEKAYPDQVRELSYREGDWTVNVNGTVFYWAEGRMLPRDLRAAFKSFSAYPFYQYSSEYDPPLPVYSDAEKERLKSWFREREEHPVNRHPGFYNALFGMKDRDSAAAQMEKISLFGFTVEVHRTLVPALVRIESDVRQTNDPQLDEYLESLRYIAGFNWRVIAGTDSLSNHSYGTALDLVPSDYKGKQVYWLWYKNSFSDPEWFTLPREERYKPPEALVRAFEAEGFIWGGKWIFFDGMHFEYRPEILILNGLL
ncbi:MAG: M15 family metallopeptidase [Spirochaetales bacterium]|nr:M15 family metallopeptidase [Spirochaetales bacterium]